MEELSSADDVDALRHGRVRSWGACTAHLVSDGTKSTFSGTARLRPNKFVYSLALKYMQIIIYDTLVLFRSFTGPNN